MLSASVQQSLAKALTAVQAETDPVFQAARATLATLTDLSNSISAHNSDALAHAAIRQLIADLALCVNVPDYANMDYQSKLLPSNNFRWVVDKAGFVFVSQSWGNSSTEADGQYFNYLYINDQIVMQLSMVNTTTYAYADNIFPVKAGDVLEYMPELNGGTIIVYYIPPIAIMPPTIPTPPASGSYTLQSVNGVMQWV
jgi:hypothetical protein